MVLDNWEARCASGRSAFLKNIAIALAGENGGRMTEKIVPDSLNPSPEKVRNTESLVHSILETHNGSYGLVAN